MRTTKTRAAKKPNVIRKSFEFRLAKSAGARLQSYNLSYQVIKKEPPKAAFRLGITVSTKIDKRAVLRNRMKRLIREAVRSLASKLPPGIDLVIIARKNFSELSMQDIAAEIKKTLVGRDY